MNYSYENWEKDFLEHIARKFGFGGNHYIAFVERLLLKNIGLSNAAILEKKKAQGELLPDNMIADSWSRVISPQLKQQGFKYPTSSDQNSNEKNTKLKIWDAARTWLISDFFPEYLKTISPQTSIELWQELWTKAEDSNIIIPDQENDTTLDLDDLGVGVAGVWNDNKNDCPSFPIGSKIKYQFNMNGCQYLIVIEKFASGEFYCFAPSQFSPSFPLVYDRVILPYNNVFTVQPPTGTEEIIAVFSNDKPEISWLPKFTELPLELKEEHLADILSYVNDNNCSMVRSKYLITG